MLPLNALLFARSLTHLDFGARDIVRLIRLAMAQFVSLKRFAIIILLVFDHSSFLFFILNRALRVLPSETSGFRWRARVWRVAVESVSSVIHTL